MSRRYGLPQRRKTSRRSRAPDKLTDFAPLPFADSDTP